MAEQKPARGALPYGPFTAQVRRFLQHLATLSPEAEAVVVEHYRVASATPEYQAAERVLGAAIARSGREAERDALGGPLLQMVRVDRMNDPSRENADATPDQPLRAIAEPALAALLAVMMQDVLSAELFTRLYAPFEHSIARALLEQ